MSEEFKEKYKNIELIPYLEKLIYNMDNTLDKVQVALNGIDKLCAIQDERISKLQEELTKFAHAESDNKDEILSQIKLFRNEYKEKQKINQNRLTILENNEFKFKWIFYGVSSIILITLFLSIDGLTIATGPWTVGTPN